MNKRKYAFISSLYKDMVNLSYLSGSVTWKFSGIFIGNKKNEHLKKLENISRINA